MVHLFVISAIKALLTIHILITYKGYCNSGPNSYKALSDKY